MEARGRPALVSGESPASVITSSPILSNSGRTPLVLLVLHPPFAYLLLSSSFSTFPSFSLYSIPFPMISLLSFESAVSPSYSPFALYAQQFFIRFIFILQLLSYIYFLQIFIVHARNCSIYINRKSRVRKIRFKYDFIFKVDFRNYRFSIQF